MGIKAKTTMQSDVAITNQHSKFDAVLFDMDGLLLDTESIALKILAETIKKSGLKWSATLGQQMIGRNAKDGDLLMQQCYGAAINVKEIRQAFLAAYEEHLQFEGVPTKSGAILLLTELNKKKVPCALVTSSRRRLTNLKLEKSNLTHFFGVTICGDELRHGKPNPEGYLLAANKLDVQPETCLVLEDSEPGIRAAIAAGMSVYCVPDQTSPSIDMLQLGIPIYQDLNHVKQSLF